MSENNKSSINPNDSAYPFICDGYVSGGLTIRQYFAAMAMQGMIISNKWEHVDEQSLKGVAHWSVRQSDALIEALNK